MQILDGKAVAAARNLEIKASVQKLTAALGRAPGLTVVLVGDDPASQVYVANKLKACQKVGIASQALRLSAEVTMLELKTVIQRLNADAAVDGILLQLPLPKALDAEEAIGWISSKKDVDCLTAENLGLLWSGRPVTTPCTPWGVIKILEHYKIPVAGKRAVVVGRSNIVGKPMAHLLVQADATVTICHSKTVTLREHTLDADIVVVAAGRPEFLGRADFKEGSVVIDVGIHRKSASEGKAKLCGDVRLAELDGVVRAATPVPGGVGPMTIAMLLENTVCLAKLSIPKH